MPAPGDPPLAVLLTTSGGLTGGDRLAFSVSADAGASAAVTTAAAEKIYRSLGADADVEIALDVADGAWLEWLPQGSHCSTATAAETQCHRARSPRPGVGCWRLEMLVFGRVARGEHFTDGEP